MHNFRGSSKPFFLNTYYLVRFAMFTSYVYAYFLAVFCVCVLENVEMYFNARSLNFSCKKISGGIDGHVIPGKLGKTCSRKALSLRHIYYRIICFQTRESCSFETLEQF